MFRDDQVILVTILLLEVRKGLTIKKGAFCREIVYPIFESKEYRLDSSPRQGISQFTRSTSGISSQMEGKLNQVSFTSCSCSKNLDALILFPDLRISLELIVFFQK